MDNKKIIIGSLMLMKESDTSIQISIADKDGKTISSRLTLAEAGEAGQTITNWVFKSILD